MNLVKRILAAASFVTLAATAAGTLPALANAAHPLIKGRNPIAQKAAPRRQAAVVHCYEGGHCNWRWVPNPGAIGGVHSNTHT
jgi:hypothetical protein